MILQFPPDVSAADLALTPKAHALSVEAFEYNREYLEDWVQRLPEVRDPVAAREQIHGLDVDHGQHVVVNYQDLGRGLRGAARGAHGRRRGPGASHRPAALSAVPEPLSGAADPCRSDPVGLASARLRSCLA